MNYCKSGFYNGITVTGVAGATGGLGSPAAATAHATTGTSTGTHASTATATGSTSSQKSSGSVNVAGMGFIGLVLALGGAMIGM